LIVVTEADKRAEQRKLVWGGCQTVLGCGGVIALVALAYVALGLLPKPATPGPNVVVFLDYSVVRTSIIWCGLVGGVLFFVALAAAKSTRGIVIVCALFIAVAGIAGWALYSRVAAIAFHDNAIELRYFWPRPAVRLSSQDILSAQYERQVRLSDDSLHEYVLQLRTRRGDHVSFGDPSLEDMQRTLRRIQDMQRR